MNFFISCVGAGSAASEPLTMNGTDISSEDLISLPGIGLVVKGSAMSEFAKLSVGNLKEKKRDERDQTF
jgi:hypothetical protein